MDSKKNRGMGKIFPCFRPDAVDHDDEDGRAFVQTNGKPPLWKGKVKHSSDESSLSSSSSSSHDANSSVDGGGGSGRSSKGSSRRRFSRAIKAVFFDTSLSRKIRERKSRKGSFRSNNSDKTANSINDKSSSFEELSVADEMNRINSNRSSIFSSSANGTSSLSSSCASSRNADSSSLTERRGGSSRTESMDGRGSFNASFRATNPVERKESFRGTKSMELQKQNSAEKKMKMDQYYSSTIGLCLLLVSLLVLVFWGKICAILCTSIWLFFGPRRIKGSLESPVKIASSMNVDSEEYKKRVIMEGLLERNRSRAAQ